MPAFQDQRPSGSKHDYLKTYIVYQLHLAFQHETVPIKKACNNFPTVFHGLLYHTGKILMRTTYLLVCKIGKTVFPAPQPTCTNKADVHIIKMIPSTHPMHLISTLTLYSHRTESISEVANEHSTDHLQISLHELNTLSSEEQAYIQALWETSSVLLEILLTNCVLLLF